MGGWKHIRNFFAKSLQIGAENLRESSLPSVAVFPDSQGPPSERDFVRALRDHGLACADHPRGEPVLGLVVPEIEEQSGLSRPSVTGLVKRFAPILAGQNLEGETRLWLRRAAGGSIPKSESWSPSKSLRITPE